MLVTGFAIVFVCCNIAYTCILITGCWSGPLIFIRLKEGTYVLSAVLYISSIRKLRCDYGRELPYTRKVAIVYYDVITIAVIVKFLLNSLAPNDTFRCHSGTCNIWVVFLALRSWNNNFNFRGPVVMWEFWLDVPTQSSRHLHSEPLSSTMLALSSSMKIAVYICVCGGIRT